MLSKNLSLTLSMLASIAIAVPQAWQAWSVPSVSAAPRPSATTKGPAPPHSTFQNIWPYLNELASMNGKYLGTATDQPGTGEDTDVAYQEILNDTRIFGQITPANGMKGVNTEPKIGIFNYTAGEVAVQIAKDQNKLLRCHNLIWSSQQPQWLTAENASWTRETLLPVMQQHIETLIMHWKYACHSWDVVNEAFASNGTLSSSPWLDAIGPDYVHIAFQYAHAAVKSTGQDIRLYYNDYGIESPSNKTDAVFQLVRDLRSQGIEIAVGLESHFTVLDSNTYSQQNAVMSALQDLDVTFALTELDVRFPELPPNQTYSYEAQAYRYWESVTACMQHSRCEGVTVWDFEDNYSWIPATFVGQGEACLYSADFSRKPAYYAVAEALQGKNCTVCGDTSLYQVNDAETCAATDGSCD